MRTVFIVAEHHDYPPGKSFIVDNIENFKLCGFKNVLLEAMDPELLLHLKKSPLDDCNNLESYQALYQSCKKSGIKLQKCDDPLSRFMIEVLKVDTAFFDEAREKKFTDDLTAQNENSIFLCGAGHAEKVAKALRKKGIHVIILMAIPPNKKEHLGLFSTSIPKEILLAEMSEMKISKNLESLLVQKIKKISEDVLIEMKQAPDKTLRPERKSLIAFYKQILAFSNLKDPIFHQNLASLEYIIGSLYAREKRFEKSIRFTHLALNRKIKYNADAKSITNTRNKLDTLKTQLKQAEVESAQAIQNTINPTF